MADGGRRSQKSQKWLEVRIMWMIDQGLDREILEGKGQKELGNRGTDLVEQAQSVKRCASCVNAVQRTSAPADELSNQAHSDQIS